MLKKKYDFLKEKKINYADLTNDAKFTVGILGSLDIFTDAHVQGVVSTTTKICEQMRMDYERLKKCVICAYLHDVGKVMIPSAVLQKNGRLTEEEYEIIKSHTIYGYDICMKYKELREYAPIVRAHHESFDGSGYPDNLIGAQIPFEASIIKVADVYDALTKKRQYKEKLMQSDALNIILEDVKKHKASARIFKYLLQSVLDELYEKLNVCERNLDIYSENVNTLNEIAEIYEQIYKKGYTHSLKNKLKRYVLAPGYDRSTNSNLLLAKQKAFEREKKLFDDFQEENKKIMKLYQETCRLGKKENWYPEERYYK